MKNRVMRFRRLPAIAVAGAVVLWCAGIPVGAAGASIPQAGPAPCPKGTQGVTCSAGPTVGTLPCQPERFPQAGIARNENSEGYEIPFTATLGPDPAPAGVSSGVYDTADPQGGWLEIQGTSTLPALSSMNVDIILGGPIVATRGQIYAQGCGLTGLPSEIGGLGADSYADPSGTGQQENPNFVFDPATPVSLGISLPGISLSPSAATPLVAYGTADGFLAASIARTPAANGGLNVNFYSTAKTTTNLSFLLNLLPASLLTSLGVNSAAGNDCTVTIGDIAAAGQKVGASGVDGLTYAQATTPVHLSTTGSVPDPNGGTDTGRPVTGPIAPSAAGDAQDEATLVAGGFPVGKITPWVPGAANTDDMPPSPNFEPGSPTCTQANANLLNEVLGLPNLTKNYFYAPGTFGVFTSS